MSPVAAPSVDSPVDSSVQSSLEEPTTTRVSSISATELHEILMRANASGNVARHANIHLGFLSVEGHPISGLTWTPRAADLTRRVREELERTRALPEVRIAEPADDSPENPQAPAAVGPNQSTIHDAITALNGLGWTKAQAKARVARACDRLAESGEGSADVAELLAAAMRD